MIKETDSPLLSSVLRGDKPLLERCLYKQGLQSCIDLRDSTRKTCLHLACKEGHLEIIELLITKGWDIEARDKLMTTPLHQAASSGHPFAISLLLKHGADSQARDSLGRSPLLYAASSIASDSIHVLLAHDAGLADTRDHSARGALHYAIFNPHSRHLDILRTLLESRVPVNAVDSENKTPLHYAAEAGRARAVRVLMKYGADPSLVEGVSGKTPVQLAVKDTVKQLMLSYEGAVEAVERPKEGDLKGRLLGILRTVQESGVVSNQHVTNPLLYSSQWVEGLSDPGSLERELAALHPAESVLKVFNVLFPYPHTLPVSDSTSSQTMNFFRGSPSKPREPGEFDYDSKIQQLQEILINKEREVDRLQTAFRESNESYNKSLGLLPSKNQLKTMEIEKTELKGECENYKSEIQKLNKIIEEQAKSLGILTGELGKRPDLGHLEQLKNKIRILEKENSDTKVQESPEVAEEDVELDKAKIEQALSTLNSSLKFNPPRLRKRLTDADLNKDQKITKSEFLRVLSSLSIPTTHKLSLQRIVGFQKGISLLPIDYIMSLVQPKKAPLAVSQSKLTSLIRQVNSNEAESLSNTIQQEIPAEIPTVPPEPFKPQPQAKSSLNGSLVIQILKGSKFPTGSLYCQVMLEGAEKTLKTTPSPGPDPEWKFKGRWRLYGTSTSSISPEIYIEIIGHSGLVSTCKLNWLSALDFPHTWNVKAKPITAEPNGKKTGTIELQLMWVPKTVFRIENGGNLHIEIPELRGVQNSLVEFSVAGVRATAPAKQDSELVLRDIRLKPDAPVPALRCSFISAETREVLVWRNLSIEPALGNQDGTGILNVPIDAKIAFSIKMKWVAYTKQEEKEEKSAVKLQSIWKGVLIRKGNTLDKKPKVKDKRLIVRENRRYLCIVIEQTANYLVKVYIADDPGIPMYDCIYSTTTDKLDLEELYRKLKFTKPEYQKEINRKIVRKNQRYYLVIVYDKEDRYLVNVHAADDPQVPMYDVVYSKNIEKQAIESVYSSLEIPNTAVAVNYLTGNLYIQLSDGKGISYVIPKFSIGEKTGLGPMGPPWANKQICLKELSIQKHYQLKLALLALETHSEEDVKTIDWAHALSTENEWTSPFPIKIHTGELTIKLLWQPQDPPTAKPTDTFTEPIEKASNKSLLKRAIMKQNNRYYLLNIVEEGNKVTAELHLADDPQTPVYEVKSTISLPSNDTSIISTLKISQDHQLTL